MKELNKIDTHTGVKEFKIGYEGGPNEHVEYTDVEGRVSTWFGKVVEVKEDGSGAFTLKVEVGG